MENSIKILAYIFQKHKKKKVFFVLILFFFVFSLKYAPAFIDDNRGNLVKARNYLFSRSYVKEEFYRISVKEKTKRYLQKGYEDIGITKWEQLIEFRKGRTNWGGLPNYLVFSERLVDCFGPNKVGGRCTCSDISEMVTAWCLAYDEKCHEMAFGMNHSFVYNETRKEVIDLFSGFLFRDTLDEFYDALYDESLSFEEDNRFVDLGQYLTAKKVRSFNIAGEISTSVGDLEKLNLIFSNHPGLKTPWKKLLPGLYGTIKNLLIQYPSYYWTGNELVFPILAKNYEVQYGSVSLMLKELFGVMSLHYSQLETFE